MDLAISGWQLDLVILKVFSSQNDLMIQLANGCLSTQRNYIMKQNSTLATIVGIHKEVENRN